MAGFGGRLINVAAEAQAELQLVRATTPDWVVARARSNSSRLQSLVATLQGAPVPSNQGGAIARDSFAGGILYFPPGVYDLGLLPLPGWRQGVDASPEARGANPFLASVVLPESVSIWLAPGAVLRLEAGCAIDLRGEIIAESVQAFDTSLGGFIILGPRQATAEVEWWGAQASASPQTNAQALQAALDSCFHLRSVQVGLVGGAFARVTRSPVALRLNGSYPTAPTTVLDGRGLPLDASITSRRTELLRFLLNAQGPHDQPRKWIAPAPTGAAIVQGRGNGRGMPLPHLYTEEAARGEEDALLRCIEMGGMKVQGVRFRVEKEEGPPCLSFVLSPEGAARAAAQVASFEQCEFASIAMHAVQLGDLPRVQRSLMGPPIVDSESADAAGADLSVLTFERCQFKHWPSLRPSREAIDRGAGNTIYIRAGNTIPLRVIDCDFRGNVAAFINVNASLVVISGCGFHNARPVAPSAPEPRDQWSLTLGFEPPHGVDVYDSAPYLTGTLVLGLPPSLGGRDTYRYSGYSANSGLLMMHCHSSGEGLFATTRPNSVSIGAIDAPVTLLHLMQRRRAQREVSPLYWGVTGQPAVLQRGFLDQVGPLVVIGARLNFPPTLYWGACQSVWVALRSRNGQENPLRVYAIAEESMVGLPLREWRLTS